jgi:glycosyltransferase involved in cell wall biosynthesis
MICFFNTNRAWGGGEKWHFEAAQFLRSHGKKVCIVAYPGGALFLKAKNYHFDVFPMTIRNLDFLNPLKIIRLKTMFQHQAVRTLILNLPSDLKCAAMAAKQGEVTHIIYRRGTAKPVSGSFINRYIFNNVLSHIICNSKDIQNKLLINHPYLHNNSKVKVIHNGVVPADFADISKKTTSRKLVIGNAGRLVDQKKQFFLVDLAKKLKTQTTIEFEIQIAGEGPLLSELKAHSERLQVKDRIRFKGFVADMAAFYQEIDLFVLTSEHEGTSNALIEAMAAGLPAIAFDISSMPEVIENGRNGYLVPYGDVDSLAASIQKLYASPALVQEMGQHSQQIVEERFNMEKNLESLFSFELNAV